MKTAILTSFATLIVTGSVMTSVEEEGPVSFAPAVFMAWGPAEYTVVHDVLAPPLRTATASARRWPTMTTRRLRRVTVV